MKLGMRSPNIKKFLRSPQNWAGADRFSKKNFFGQKIAVSGFGRPGWRGYAIDTFQMWIFLFGLSSSTRMSKRNFDRLSPWTSREPNAGWSFKIFVRRRPGPYRSARPPMDMLLVSIERAWRPLSKNQLPDPIGPCAPEESAKIQIHLSKVSIGANVWEAFPPDRVIGGMSLRCQFVRI